MYRFTDRETEQLGKRGIIEYAASEQLNILSEGAPFADVIAPAVVGNGICVITEEEKIDYMELYKIARADSRIMKFVPASGAATRMFNDLIKSSQGEIGEEALKTLNNIKEFAFYEDLEKLFLFRNLDIDKLIENRNWKEIIDHILYEKGLNYADKPKAMIKFTKYDGYTRTAMEEQIYEAITVCTDKDNLIRIHFTVSEKYIPQVNEMISDLREELSGITLDFSLSVQKPSTDTLAVYADDNTPVKNENGELVFRPGGHGALIENLNDLDADIVIIKNIDNAVNKEYRQQSEEYTKLLLGYLLNIENKVKSFLKEIDILSQDSIEEIKFLSRKYFSIDLEKQMEYLENHRKNDFLFDFLNRPIRVCGMIRNTGEPGGGPFFVKNRKGISLQIVESSQIDLNDPLKKRIFERSTHFNPVLLVCSLRDYRNEKFDLKKFVDRDSYFVSKKTFNGREIKALELPGLWNGAMSDWISAFVEIPLETFCPAKTVNDLLKKERYQRPLGQAE
ncbi:MAG: DUF4301 family protein [Candidatus Delongbacteria bacterium]|jgi:hypothetical protein|nr:DUF4301 family protein [Candidatus Delongbacteria bacterium]